LSRSDADPAALRQRALQARDRRHGPPARDGARRGYPGLFLAGGAREGDAGRGTARVHGAVGRGLACFSEAIAARTFGASPAPPASRWAKIARFIRGSQNFLMCSAIPGTALSWPWLWKNLPIWLAM